MQCEMCQRPNKWSDWDIKEYQYWRAGLHPDQRYLGRSLVMLNRHAEDLLETTQEERTELFQILGTLTDGLTELFSPDKFNYASLGNETPHLHLHVIPRYASPREFEGITFEDQRWGKNPSPSEAFDITQEAHDKVIASIEEQL